jgi:hypothetical protein
MTALHLTTAAVVEAAAFILKFVLGSHILIVPHQKPFLKPYLVELVLQAIDEIEELEDDKK